MRGDRDRTKRPKMAQGGLRLADFSIVTSDNPRGEDPQAIIDEIITDFPRTIMKSASTAAKPSAGRLVGPKDQIVLIAGKGHEDYQVFKTVPLPLTSVKS